MSRNIKRPISETGFSERNRQIFDEQRRASARTNGLYWATVEDDYDPQKQGRVLVNIPDLSAGSSEYAGKKKENGANVGFIWCYPMMPSFGTTDSLGSEDGFSNSYGFWGPQPRKGDIVVVGFLNGTMAIWLGCLPKPRKNFQVPGVPGAISSNHEFPAPVSEKAQTNTEDRKVMDDLQQRILNAGLANDRIRGIGTSGSARESPSKVAGMLTPGHPKDGVPGHSFIMDDLPEQQGIRFRTSRGHQITFSDVSDSIYIATGQGNAWVEITDNGKIDVYSKSSISVHSEADINVRADGDYILDVAGDFIHKVAGDYKLEVGGNTDQTFDGYLKTNVGRTYDIATTGNYKLVSQGRLDTLSTSTTSISSKSKLLAWGTGIVGIDSGVQVYMEADVASLPSFAISSTAMATTLNALGGASSQITDMVNSVNVSSLIGGLDAGVLSGAVEALGPIAASVGIDVSEISSMVSTLAQNGIDISNIPSQLQGVIELLQNPNISQLGILSNLGLSLPDFDISSLGLTQVLSNINLAGISQFDATTLFGADIGTAFAEIATKGSALSKVNQILGKVELNSFREQATGILSNINTSNLSETEAGALVSQLSSITAPRVNVSSVLNSLTGTLENPNAGQIDIFNRLGVNVESMNIGGTDISSVLGILNERGLTLDDARGLFGREHGGQILDLINNSSNISSMISSIGTLGSSALTNLVSGGLSGLGIDLANVTGLLNNIDLPNIDIGNLGGVLDNALTGAASSSKIPTAPLPGPPSVGQAQTAQPGSNQAYAAKRVPQHEPWKPEGRVVPPAVGTTGAGEKSASDHGVTSPADRSAAGSSTSTSREGLVLDPDDIRYLVVHCSATPVAPNHNKESIERYHVGVRGWSRIGYHYIIEYDGSISVGSPENVRGIHVGADGVNYVSLGICLIGGIDSEGRAAANFRSVQLAALSTLLDELEGRYPTAELMGHRDFNGSYSNPAERKDCPSMNVQRWRTTGVAAEPRAPAV